MLLFVTSTPNEVIPSRVSAVKDSQIHFVAGCHKRRGCFCPMSYSSLLSIVFLVFRQGHFDYVWLFCLSWLLWFDCEHYSRWLDWKDSFPKWPVMCWLGRQTLLTHCLAHWVEWTMLILSCDNLMHAPSSFTFKHITVRCSCSLLCETTRIIPCTFVHLSRWWTLNLIFKVTLCFYLHDYSWQKKHVA